jgi:predicted Zn-dependent peptidase
MSAIPSRAGIAAAVLAAVAALPAAAQDLAAFEKRLTERTLDNGLKLLVYERPGAPVVSFYTYVDAGSAQEVPGITGLAHMFEHMAFKGTTRIGTSDWDAEKQALAAVDAAYNAYDAERRKRGGADPQRLAELEKAFRDAQEAANRFVVKNEFGEIIDREGGTGLNASTSSDATLYYYSLPANKVELWAYLESERFLDPVLREFYKERDVVMEERRMRVDSNPIGGLIEEFVSASFRAHPYGQSGIGWVSDLQSFSREDAEAFFRTWYVPNNMTIAVVGDVRAPQVMPILERYFSRLPRGPQPPALRTVEPARKGEISVSVTSPAQPIYVEGYLRPAAGHADDAVYDAIADILSTDRTSRLYRSLVRDKKIAAASGAFNGFPGSKYPNLMLFYAVPTPGHTNEEVQAAIRAEIERMKSESVTDEELRMVKTRAKAGLIRGLDSNQGLAAQLATYEALYGDWRELFRSVEKIEKVTKEDIQRVARATLVDGNRTVGMIVNQAKAAPAAGAGK